MQRAEAIMGLVLLVGGLLLMREAARVPITWTDVGPGAGFFPFWLAAGVALGGAVIAVQNLQPAGEGARPARTFIPPEVRRRLLVAFVPMVLLVAAIRYLGIYLGGALYLALYMATVGRHRWWSTALVSVLIPLALFLIFERWFLLPMPKGMWLERVLYGR